MMRLFEACPARRAAAVLTDTAEHERTHTDLKRFAGLSNQRKQTATLQVRRKVARWGCTERLSHLQMPHQRIATSRLPPACAGSEALPAGRGHAPLTGAGFVFWAPGRGECNGKLLRACQICKRCVNVLGTAAWLSAPICPISCALSLPQAAKAGASSQPRIRVLPAVGVTVEVGQLAEGRGTSDSKARAVLAGRPALKHLEYYLSKHGLPCQKVSALGQWGLLGPARSCFAGR